MCNPNSFTKNQIIYLLSFEMCIPTGWKQNVISLDYPQTVHDLVEHYTALLSN